MSSGEITTLTERAEALAATVLERAGELDQQALTTMLYSAFREVTRDERNRCADEIGSHNTYQGRGSHFAGILRRGSAGHR